MTERLQRLLGSQLGVNLGGAPTVAVLSRYRNQLHAGNKLPTFSPSLWILGFRLEPLRQRLERHDHLLRLLEQLRRHTWLWD